MISQVNLWRSRRGTGTKLLEKVSLMKNVLSCISNHEPKLLSKSDTFKMVEIELKQMEFTASARSEQWSSAWVW